METRIVLALNYVLQVNFRLDIMLFELIKKIIIIIKKNMTPTWFEHATFWSGVRRATVAPRSRMYSEIYTQVIECKLVAVISLAWCNLLRYGEIYLYIFIIKYLDINPF